MKEVKNEIWKDIYFIKNGTEFNYIGSYQVSNYGRVKSLKNNKEKILKLTIDNNGYSKIGLYSDGKIKNFSVHRLVATMFIPNPENKPEVDHIIPLKNGGTNEVTNLKWTTREENCNNNFSKVNYSNANRKKKPMKNKFGKNHNRSKPIIGININDETDILFFYSAKEAKRFNEKFNHHISDVCNYNRNKEEYLKRYKQRKYDCGGYNWYFLDDCPKNILINYIINSLKQYIYSGKGDKYE